MSRQEIKSRFQSLKNLQLLPQSFDTMKNIDVNIAANILQTLNDQPQLIAVKSSAVGCAKQWFELRFSTGSDDDGRIYYFRSPKNGKRLVLISLKRNQKQDFIKLKNIR